MSHRRVNHDLATIRAISLDDLARDLHELIELNRLHPSTPDGYPTRTPGASTPTATRRPDTDDAPVALTSVEAAVEARTHAPDPHLTAQHRAEQHIARAANELTAARRELDNARRTTTEHTGTPTPGCWAMARIGQWEDIHRTTDLEGLLDEPRPLGLWAYKFARRNGRLPTIDECKRHHNGQRIYLGA